MAAIAAASIAATAAGLTYLDGRFHLRQDWHDIRSRAAAAKLLQKAVQDKRVSPYYFFEARAQAHPEKEAIWSRNHGVHTYDATYRRANQFSRWFLDNGVRPGDFVAFFMANSPDFVFAWLGLLAIGAAPALINHNLTRQALLHCLAISEAKLVLADGPPQLLERLDAVREDLAAQDVRIVNLADARSEIDTAVSERPPDELRDGVRPDSPFGLFYTSGTTGLPKACALPAAASFNYGVSRACGFSYVQGDNQRYYDCMPLYHGTGGISGMTQLLTGQTLCLAPRFSVSGFWDDVRDSGATWFVYVGETLRYLLAAPPSPRDRDHKVHSIYGNGLRPDVWKPFRDRFGIGTIYEFFNSTEGIMPLDNPARGDFRAHAVGHHGLLQRRRFQNVFVPVEIDVDTGDIARDPQTGFARRVPYSVGGEILVAQPPTITPPFPGYYRNEEATSKKYVRDIFRKGDLYYRTGDALRRDDDGRWFFLDRLGDTFRWKGENVSTAEVSEVLGRYPGVSEATVYGVSLPNHDGKAGMAAIYVDPAVKNFDYNGLLKHARTHLPKYAVPVFVRRIGARSATHNNKQDKMPLKRAGVDPEQTGADPVLWVPDHAKGGEAYVPFSPADWDSLKGGRAKL
ncbi:acetyl-CoA synthetase-like protein [Durotheca rogersii]|uniref:acetyl-CoA synthetase-like protein n=1 Tax=Durotheca rogersii TaxID=419775 RepID=UPI00221F8FF6|nr:acetyl-CoA synthetase-like protein [Durotheca rogersii]KAI5856152.1 acetyl-CoA synthetase-like protein [Durotheca rogersii]